MTASNSIESSGMKNPWNVSSSTEGFLSLTEIEEVLDAQRSLSSLSSGLNQQCVEIESIINPGFKLTEWVHANFLNYHMHRSLAGVGIWAYGEGPNDNVMVEFTLRVLNLRLVVKGTFEGTEKFSTWHKTQGFRQKEIMVEWVFGPNYREMEGFDLPLEMLPEIPGSYPWMKESIADFTNRFQSSRESVLVLKGAPGTGKTSFIKRLISESKTSAMVTYDTQLLFSDGFFAHFMTKGGTNLLVIEDADEMLTDRSAGNQLMDKLLNASDGLISLRHKKIIFSTNLGSVSSIDPALLRRGRCFDILDFRKLTLEEATTVGVNFYGKNPELLAGSYTLAEVTNLDPEKMKISSAIARPGFLG